MEWSLTEKRIWLMFLCLNGKKRLRLTIVENTLPTVADVSPLGGGT